MSIDTRKLYTTSEKDKWRRPKKPHTQKKLQDLSSRGGGHAQGLGRGPMSRSAIWVERD